MPEIRIVICAQLPDDVFDLAKAVGAITEPLQAFKDALEGAGIVATITTIQHEDGSGKVKAPRKPRADAGVKRGPKASNGSTADVAHV